MQRSSLFGKSANSLALLCKLPEYAWLLLPTKRIFVSIALTWGIFFVAYK